MRRGGEDRINEGWPGSAPPPHWSKTRLAFSSWGVCVPMCMPLCVQNMDGRCGLPLGSEVTSASLSLPTQGLNKLPLGSFPEPTQGSALPLAMAARLCSDHPPRTFPAPRVCGRVSYLPPHPAQCLRLSQGIYLFKTFWPQRVLAAALGSFGVDLGLCSCGIWDL